MAGDIHGELKSIIGRRLTDWEHYGNINPKGSISIKKDINRPTKDLPNTPPNNFSVYVYTVPSLLGHKVNITIDGPDNGKEALSIDKAANVIDQCVPVLGKQKKYLLNIRFHSTSYNVVNESKLGIQTKFACMDLDFGITDKLPRHIYLKKIEEAIYRYAVFNMCVDARFTNKNKDGNFISEKILGHIKDKTRKKSLTDEIMDCFAQNHNLLESAGVLYFIDRAYLKSNLPDYYRLVENLSAQKIDYEYFPPALTNTDEVYTGVRMGTKPVKVNDTPAPQQTSKPDPSIEQGDSNKRTLPDYFYRTDIKPAENKKPNPLGIELNSGPLTRIDGNLVYSSGDLVGRIDGNRIYIKNQIIVMDGNLIYMNGDLIGKIDNGLIYINGNLVGKIEENIIYGR